MAFNEDEQRLYKRVHEEAKREFRQYLGMGGHYVATHLLSIMSLLNPLRAICSGGVLREKVNSSPAPPRFSRSRANDE